jgi:hypothetical protein
VSGRPILITGSHRSGTTWVGRALESGGEVGYIDEPFGRDHRPGILPAAFPHWFPAIRPEQEQELQAQVARMLDFRYQVGAELRSLRSAKDAGRMVRDAGRFRRYRRRGLRPLLKDPIALFAAPWLSERFQMQVVVMIRHPAAFASSLKRMNWSHPFADFRDQQELMEGPLREYAASVDDYCRAEHDIVDQATLMWTMFHDVIDTYRQRHPEWLFVRHEDVSRAPASGIAEICAYAGIEYNGAVADYVGRTTVAGNPAEAPSGQAHQLRRDSAAATTTWKTRLTPDEIRRVRERTGPVASRFYHEDEW